MKRQENSLHVHMNAKWTAAQLIHTSKYGISYIQVSVLRSSELMERSRLTFIYNYISHHSSLEW